MAQLAINLAIGFAAQALISGFQPRQQAEGGRLSDLSAPKFNYGAGIPMIWGKVRVTGNVIWTTKIEESVKRRGKGFLRPRRKEYSYYGNFASLMAINGHEGGINSVRRVWLDHKLVYDIDSSDSDTLGESSKFLRDYMRIYLGTATQGIDSMLSSQMPETANDYGLPRDEPARSSAIAILKSQYGIGDPFNTTPAYRNRCYLSFEGLPLKDYGNRLPSSASAELLGNPSPCYLSTIISDLCLMSNLSASEIDVTEVSNIPVTSFFINGRSTGIRELELLQKAYFFDVIKSQNVLRFVPQTRGRTLISIPNSYLAAREHEQSRPDSYEHEINQNVALPSEVSVTYFDTNLDYAENVQSYIKQTNTISNKESLVLSLGLTSSEARTVAERNLILQWTEERHTYKLDLPPAMMSLEPGDVLTLLIDGFPTLLEIRKIELGANYVLKAECKRFDKDVLSYSRTILGGLTQSAVVDQGGSLSLTNVRNFRGVTDDSGRVYTEGTDYTYNPETQTVVAVRGGGITSGTKISVLYDSDVTHTTTTPESHPQGDTDLVILDIPRITEADSEGIYYTGNGGRYWRSASLFASYDNSRYDFAGTIDTRGCFGTCQNTLGVGTTWDSTTETLDTTNTLSVRLGFGNSLETVTDVDLDNDLNIASVGSEIIQFKTAARNTDETWTISNLRRGLRGTGTSHEGGETFTLLTGDDSYVEQLPINTTNRGKTLYLKAITEGQNLEDVTATTLVLRGEAIGEKNFLIYPATQGTSPKALADFGETTETIDGDHFLVLTSSGYQKVKKENIYDLSLYLDKTTYDTNNDGIVDTVPYIRWDTRSDGFTAANSDHGLFIIMDIDEAKTITLPNNSVVTADISFTVYLGTAQSIIYTASPGASIQTLSELVGGPRLPQNVQYSKIVVMFQQTENIWRLI